jgi:hypothetical protein
MKTLLVFPGILLAALAPAQQAMYENRASGPAGGGNSSGIFSGYIANGLVEWNKLNDGGGTVAADASGNGNTLPLFGAPAWSSGWLNLNGTSQYGDAGSNQLSSLDQHDLTICAWVNKNTSSLKGIVDKSFAVAGVGYGGWSLRALADNQLDWWIENGLDYTDGGAETITLGQWTFVTVTWHYLSGRADFYINGVLNSEEINGAPIENRSGSADLEVGDMQNNGFGGAYAFDGALHDVGIYNRALSAAEIGSNYLGTEFNTNVNVPDLLYYKMTESAQTHAPAFLADSSTHGGTTGTVFMQSTLQWVPNVASIPATALHFDGFSTYIDTSNTVLFNFTTNLFTINLWVRPQAGYGTLMDNGYYQTNGWYLGISGFYQIQFGAETNGADNVISTSTGAVEPGLYTMVTVVRTGPTNALIYINGIQAGTAGSLTIPAPSVNSLQFGVDRTRGNYLNGDLWLPQVWGEALTPAEVANLYFVEQLGQPWPNAGSSATLGYLTNGLVEWNKFNDDGGAVAADSSGNGNTLPLTGSPAWGAADISFNGSSQYADAGRNQLSSLDQHDVTIGVWLNKNAPSMKGIVDKSYVIPGVGYGGWSFRTLANNQLDWWVENGLDYTDGGAATLAQGQWTYATVVWHYSAHEADFYINGVVNSRVGNGAAVQNPGGQADLQVADMQDNASGGLYAFDGAMHDLGIYNRALSDAEVQSNYLSTEFGTNVSAPDLLYYKMAEAGPTNPPVSLADSSTHGGTTGTILAQSALVWVANGASIPETALHFNGVSTYIETSNSVFFNFTTNLFTINFWVCPLTANGCLMENGNFQTNGWYLNVGGAYQVQFGAETNGSNVFLTTGAGAAQVGVWTMVTLVRTAPTNVFIYINGNQAATTGSFTSPAGSTNSLRMGMDRAGAHFLDGDIWLPQIWGEALPATSVANLYFAQIPGHPWP